MNLLSRGLLAVVLAFAGLVTVGLVGIFIGPTLLAVGHALLLRWLAPDDPSKA